MSKKSLPKPLNILIASSEAVPYSETAGLALAVGEQAEELAAQGHNVTVVTPWYSSVDPNLSLISGRYRVPFNNPEECFVRIGKAEKEVGKGKITYLFVDHEDFNLVTPKEAYDAPDAARRFARFCRAVPVAAAAAGIKPDVIHAHDWATGYLPAILKHDTALLPTGFSNIPCVFNLHNANHDKASNIDETINWLRLPRKDPSAMHMHYAGHGHTYASALWMGVGNADRVIAVSPTYAEQLTSKDYSFRSGLDLPIFKKKIHGILNGVNMGRWDPQLNTGYEDLLYSSRDLSGKAAVKDRYCRDPERNFTQPDKPLLCFLGREGPQKGINEIMAAIPEILAQGWNVLIAGPAENGAIRTQLEELEEKFSGRLSVRTRYTVSPRLNRVFASADAFLMPSRDEPCGLAHVQAMRYGAVPIVTKVGGHADTVFEGKNGFLFDPPPTKEGIVEATKRAMATYMEHPEKWQKMQKAGMEKDFSWKKSAGEYVELYRDVIKERAQVRSV